jgi:predicted ester cyclase
MSLIENKAVVVRFNKEFLEGGNTGILKEIMANNFTNHTAAPGIPSDVRGVIQYVNIMRKGFPDLTVEIHDQIAENDLVVTRKTIHATHLGEIMGHAPTGKKVSISVIDIVRVREGRYVDHWGRNDMTQVIQQL